MLDKTKPMTLGDIFSNAFDLIKETFTRNIVIAAVFMIPTGILTAYGFETYFKIAMSTVNANESQNLFLASFSALFPSTIFSLALLASWIGITKIGCENIEGRRISLSDTFREIFSVTYLRCIGAILLMIAAWIFFLILAVIMIKISSYAAIVFIAGIFFVFSLGFRCLFVPTDIIYEYKGISKSFSKSLFLVKGYWWKTFWRYFLISIIIGFATGIISTPITFIFEWKFISQFFNMVQDNTHISDPTVMLEFSKSFGFTYGLILVISTILNTLIYPLFYLILFFDLKIRKNDFPQEEPVVEDNLTIGEIPVE
jgi:hypothetical protein